MVLLGPTVLEIDCFSLLFKITNFFKFKNNKKLSSRPAWKSLTHFRNRIDFLVFIIPVQILTPLKEICKSMIVSFVEAQTWSVKMESSQLSAMYLEMLSGVSRDYKIDWRRQISNHNLRHTAELWWRLTQSHTQIGQRFFFFNFQNVLKSKGIAFEMSCKKGRQRLPCMNFDWFPSLLFSLSGGLSWSAGVTTCLMSLWLTCCGWTHTSKAQISKGACFWV